MINCEWHNDIVCDNCKLLKPQVVEITLPTMDETHNIAVQLCSDCVADLKKRLS